MRRWLPLVLLAACLPIAVQAANPNAEFDRAQQAFDRLEYPQAAKALEAAWLVEGNDRKTVLGILSLQGVIAATLGQQDAARGFFHTLLSLAPDTRIDDSAFGPRVMNLFYEAKGRAASEATFDAAAAPAERAGGRVRSVGVTVRSDPLGMARSVRFFVQVPGQAETTHEVPLGDAPRPEPVARLPVDASSLSFWAQVRGERGRVLWELGSPAAPMRESAVEAASPSAALGHGSPFKGPARLAAVGIAGAGIVAAVVGAIFGGQSASARAKLSGAERDAEGRVTGLTRSEALALDASVRSNATVANGLFIAAAALAGTGAALFLVSDRVALSASPSGVSVQGVMP